MGISKLQENEIIESYKQGKSIKQCASIVGVTEHYVKKTLKEHDIKRRTNEETRAKSFTHEQEEEVIQHYKDGKSIREIAEIYGVSTMPVARVFKERGFETRDISEARREWKINENYFDEINTPNKAYIVGWLYSDGANTSNYINHYCISISIQDTDHQILEDISKELGTDRPLLYYKDNRGGEYCRLNITNKHIAIRLLELGMTPNKTLSITYPKWLKPELHSHFIRGMSDGDGYISARIEGSKAKKYQYQATIVGTEEICNSMCAILNAECDCSAHVYSIGKDRNLLIKTLSICGRDNVNKYLDYIYKDSDTSLRLERKYQRYLKSKNE